MAQPPKPFFLAFKIILGKIPAVWVFPLILSFVVLTLSAFSISGSSVGMYYIAANGPKIHDPNLLYGKPQSVRSDEWLVNTAMTVAQYRENFPRVNPNVGAGEDVSVILDVPYRDWSTFFRPQNWSFFILPVEIAFAFKWWLLGALVVITLYFLILKFLPKRYVLASLLALGFIWSPFMQWWYQSITLAPVAFGMGALLVLMQLHITHAKKWLLAWSLLLAYLLTCFILVLYPPFQIVVAEVVVVIYLGFLLERGGFNKDLLRRQGPFILGAIVMAGLLALAFLSTRADVISAITHTVYPGQRMVASGGFGWDRLLSGFVSFRLEFAHAAAHFYTNQSEGSSFIFIWPFLLIPSGYALINQWRHERKLNWSLILVHTLILIILAHLFLSLSSQTTKLLGFSGILQNRALLSLGLLALFQLVFVIRTGLTRQWPRWLAISMGVVAFGIQLGAGLTLSANNPGYITHQWEIGVMAALVGLAVSLILWGRLILGVGLWGSIGLFSIFYIHPLYHGLSPLLSTNLSRAIHTEQTKQPGPWVVLDNVPYANYAITSGVPSYSGVYTYPQLNLWHRLDPNQTYSEAYNRYGFAFFTTQTLPTPIALKSGDSFQVRYNACDSQTNYIKHVMATEQLTSPCLTLDQTISYQAMSFYLYHFNK